MRGGSGGNRNLTRVKFKDGVTGLRAEDIKEAWEQRDDTHCLQPKTAVRGYRGYVLRAGAERLMLKNTVGRLVAGFFRPWEHATGTRQYEGDPSCLSSVLPLQGHSSMKDKSVRKKESVQHMYTGIDVICKRAFPKKKSVEYWVKKKPRCAS